MSICTNAAGENLHKCNVSICTNSTWAFAHMQREHLRKCNVSICTNATWAFAQMQRENNRDFFQNLCNLWYLLVAFQEKVTRFLLDDTIHSSGCIRVHSCENTLWNKDRTSYLKLDCLIHLCWFDFLNYFCGRHSSSSFFLEDMLILWWRQEKVVFHI